jgi:hypothetical protein
MAYSASWMISAALAKGTSSKSPISEAMEIGFIMELS